MTNNYQQVTLTGIGYMPVGWGTDNPLTIKPSFKFFKKRLSNSILKVSDLFYLLNIYSAAPGLRCSMRDLVP